MTEPSHTELRMKKALPLHMTTYDKHNQLPVTNVQSVQRPEQHCVCVRMYKGREDLIRSVTTEEGPFGANTSCCQHKEPVPQPWSTLNIPPLVHLSYTW